MPSLNSMVQNLCAILDRLNGRIGVTATATGCLYKSGGTTHCVETTPPVCLNILHGQPIASCAGQGALPDIPNPEIGEDTITQLVKLVNDANALLPRPAPLGACTYSAPSGRLCIETINDVCTDALGGDFK